jgi:threonine/homoserine/homoserine lactone efflux protein
MPDASTYALFVAAALALLLVPGPAVIYIVARSVEGGRLTGLISVCGIELGTLLHVVFAAAGLSAIVVSSAAALSVVKWLGATLAFLGMFTDGLYALLGGTAGDWIRNKNLGLRRAGRYVTGGVYMALGAVAAISSKD